MESSLKTTSSRSLRLALWAAISPVLSYTSPSKLRSTNFNDHALDLVRHYFANHTSGHFSTVNFGLTGTKITEAAFGKFCETLQTIRAERCYLGAASIKVTKSALSFLVDLCSKIQVESFSFGFYMIAEFDRHDYENIRAALKSNAHLKVRLLNYVSD